jgi:hypothetical protein
MGFKLHKARREVVTIIFDHHVPDLNSFGKYAYVLASL